MFDEVVKQNIFHKRVYAFLVGKLICCVNVKWKKGLVSNIFHEQLFICLFINFNKESMDPSDEKLASYSLLIGNHKV
jgi:hypothetical protein